MNVSATPLWVHLERDDSDLGFRFTLNAEHGENTEDTVMWISSDALGIQFLALSQEEQMVEVLSFSRETLKVVDELFGIEEPSGSGGMLN